MCVGKIHHQNVFFYANCAPQSDDEAVVNESLPNGRKRKKLYVRFLNSEATKYKHLIGSQLVKLAITKSGPEHLRRNGTRRSIMHTFQREMEPSWVLIFWNYIPCLIGIRLPRRLGDYMLHDKIDKDLTSVSCKNNTDEKVEWNR